MIAVACELASAMFYYRDIFRGNTKPHLYTHLIFAIIMTVGLFGILAAGGAAGAWAYVVSVIFETSLVWASLKWGTTDVTNADRIFLVLALGSILPWILTKNPLWSVILISIIDVLGMLPTIRKTYNTPSSEPLSAWLLAMIRGVFQLAALGAYSLTTVLYPLEIFSIEVVLVTMMMFRRSHSKVQ